MRFANPMLVLIALCFSGAAFAQVPYVSIEDRFRTNFPAEPTLENIKYDIEFHSTGEMLHLDAHKYTAEWNGGTYSVISVNFAPYLEPHNGTIQGARDWAATQYRKMGEVTYDGYQRTDRIPGSILYITLPDGDRLYVIIILHQERVLENSNNLTIDHPAQRRLLITEARVSPDERPPSLFLTSLQVIDAEGFPIRYEPNEITRLPVNRGGGGD